MSWPTKFRIKSRWWEIHYVDRIPDEGCEDPSNPDNDLLGMTRADLRTIWISKDQSDECMRDTVVHELMHAVYSTAQRCSGSDMDEVEENWVLGATEAFFEIVENSETFWWHSKKGDLS